MRRRGAVAGDRGTRLRGAHAGSSARGGPLHIWSVRRHRVGRAGVPAPGPRAGWGRLFSRALVNENLKVLLFIFCAFCHSFIEEMHLPGKDPFAELPQKVPCLKKRGCLSEITVLRAPAHLFVGFNRHLDLHGVPIRKSHGEIALLSSLRGPAPAQASAVFRPRALGRRPAVPTRVFRPGGRLVHLRPPARAV